VHTAIETDLFTTWIRSVRSKMTSTMQETKHLCRWRQEKVAKIVQSAPPLIYN